jgi:hypothetical protein
MGIKNHESGAPSKVEFLDLPFNGVRQFRGRVGEHRILPGASIGLPSPKRE